MDTSNETDLRALRQANAGAITRLTHTVEKLRALLADEQLMESTPMEVQTDMGTSIDAVCDAIALLGAPARQRGANIPRTPGGPTRQQGQFLAFIREFMMRNEQGIAPSHAELQRFFHLTPPSVNSMLIRLEQRGFIRRIPGRARAIELTLDPELIPPLDRPFKLRP